MVSSKVTANTTFLTNSATKATLWITNSKVRENTSTTKIKVPIKVGIIRICIMEEEPTPSQIIPMTGSGVKVVNRGREVR